MFFPPPLQLIASGVKADAAPDLRRLRLAPRPRDAAIAAPQRRRARRRSSRARRRSRSRGRASRRQVGQARRIERYVVEWDTAPTFASQCRHLGFAIDGSGLGSYDYSAFEVADYACVELAPLGAKAVTAAVSDQTLGGVKFTFGDATDEASRTIVVLEEPSAANALQKGESITIGGASYEIAHVNPAQRGVPYHDQLICGTDVTCLQLVAPYTGVAVNGSSPIVNAFEGATVGLAHAITIEDLTPGVPYYFRVGDDLDQRPGRVGDLVSPATTSLPGAPGRRADGRARARALGDAHRGAADSLRVDWARRRPRRATTARRSTATACSSRRAARRCRPCASTCSTAPSRAASRSRTTRRRCCPT